MNENLNLVEILKDCPVWTKLYSTVHGNVKLTDIKSNHEYPVKYITSNGLLYSVTAQGLLCSNLDGECTLFPSKEQRDWSKFNVKKPKFKVGDRIRHKETNKDDVYEISKVYDDSYGIAGFTWMIYMKYQDQYELVPNKFDPKTLCPFDKVLVRDKDSENWTCGFFSHKDESMSYSYRCVGTPFVYCIPYNDDTKHLVNTTDEAPEYYRYWED